MLVSYETFEGDSLASLLELGTLGDDLVTERWQGR